MFLGDQDALRPPCMQFSAGVDECPIGSLHVHCSSAECAFLTSPFRRRGRRWRTWVPGNLRATPARESVPDLPLNVLTTQLLTLFLLATPCQAPQPALADLSNQDVRSASVREMTPKSPAGRDQNHSSAASLMYPSVSRAWQLAFWPSIRTLDHAAMAALQYLWLEVEDRAPALQAGCWPGGALGKLCSCAKPSMMHLLCRNPLPLLAACASLSTSTILTPTPHWGAHLLCVRAAHWHGHVADAGLLTRFHSACRADRHRATTVGTACRAAPAWRSTTTAAPAARTCELLPSFRFLGVLGLPGLFSDADGKTGSEATVHIAVHFFWRIRPCTLAVCCGSAVLAVVTPCHIACWASWCCAAQSGTLPTQLEQCRHSSDSEHIHYVKGERLSPRTQVGNFLSDRPSSRVTAPPGGASQVFFG